MIIDQHLVAVFLGNLILLGFAAYLGSYVMLYRKSLVGDAVAHATLPGICFAILLTGSRSTTSVFVGGAIGGALGVAYIYYISSFRKAKTDAAITTSLVSLFSFGTVLLSYLQQRPNINIAGINSFFFGQATSLLRSEILMIVAIVSSSTLVLLIIHRQLTMLIFDKSFSKIRGFPVVAIDACLVVIIVVTVTMMLHSLGMILSVSGLILPAVAAGLWTKRLIAMILLSIAFGLVATTVGFWCSAINISGGISPGASLPTGPLIVMVGACLLLFSAIMGTRRGIFRAALTMRRNNRKILDEHVLKDCFTAILEQRQTDVALQQLRGIRGIKLRDLSASLRRLTAAGLVKPTSGRVSLTKKGEAASAAIIRKHRIWETFLARELRIEDDHLHRDAEIMEHILPDDLVDEYDRELNYPKKDPHGSVIPRNSDGIDATKDESN